ncbi:MAG: acyl-CoA thioesterase [Gammaproteobacteria bacterium]|jgi:acyl-CoA thioester hydrolase|uniref:Acyl-CoA thioester hydrolase n=1 Tax=Marinomonas polaris DSM 16579 TaxID=1122206 RepID=A0A1M4ZQ05_9GAMM|nr:MULTISPECIES: acyl-CoA thioesterase [Marinomonas]MBU1296478.1 acyl-CoA thioesterase [Gammaproteobacteria bacterium]MBU1466118.1 acyl-CoA thioesterase [Gammaproteobacteria bacterium]MBU2022335.1 acyl-CoA thioesterase [Gammaproteobacteria bacterium]MBU2237075.1 acyl-CoA thioesterase [Gammaproteobacteria bacterium]MBU2319879.1 acyl-CoA thioesterase [Gammaproteobacteria bacterium]|tara:strand:+ start:19759 stop:20157 length:399 start_codon:yes stop_codon:yes gene_type:complete
MKDKLDHKDRIYFEVRDYECDMQGIVNNSVYQNYLEHARHQFIKSRGLDFAEITKQGIYLVLIKAELDYMRSLRSGDTFYIHTTIERVSKLKLNFLQQVHQSDNDQLILSAKMTVTSTTKKGLPIVDHLVAS